MAPGVATLSAYNVDFPELMRKEAAPILQRPSRLPKAAGLTPPPPTPAAAPPRPVPRPVPARRPVRPQASAAFAVAAAAFEPSVRMGPHSGVDLSALLLERTLGCGGFATVSAVTPTLLGSGPRPAALKIIHSTGPLHDRRIRLEAKAMVLLAGCPLVTRLLAYHGPAAVGGTHRLLIELGDGSLYDVLRKVAALRDAAATSSPSAAAAAARAPLVKPQRLQRIIGSLLLTLSHLHALGLSHGDVKPENILLDGPCFKLADFGAAVVHDDDAGMVVWTNLYCPPEFYAGRRASTREGDMWAAGVVLVQLIVGPVPSAAGHALRAGHAAWRLPAGTPADLVSLARLLLQPNPQLRGTFGKVFTHPFFHDFDWASVFPEAPARPPPPLPRAAAPAEAAVSATSSAARRLPEFAVPQPVAGGGVAPVPTVRRRPIFAVAAVPKPPPRTDAPFASTPMSLPDAAPQRPLAAMATPGPPGFLVALYKAGGTPGAGGTHGAGALPQQQDGSPHLEAQPCGAAAQPLWMGHFGQVGLVGQDSAAAPGVRGGVRPPPGFMGAAYAQHGVLLTGPAPAAPATTLLATPPEAAAGQQAGRVDVALGMRRLLLPPPGFTVALYGKGQPQLSLLPQAASAAAAAAACAAQDGAAGAAGRAAAGGSAGVAGEGTTGGNEAPSVSWREQQHPLGGQPLCMWLLRMCEARAHGSAVA